MNDLVSKYDVLHLLYNIFEKHNMATDKTDALGGFGKEVFDTIKAMSTVDNTIQFDTDKIIEQMKTKSVFRPNSLQFYKNSQDGRYVDEVILLETAINIIMSYEKNYEILKEEITSADNKDKERL